MSSLKVIVLESNLAQTTTELERHSVQCLNCVTLRRLPQTTTNKLQLLKLQLILLELPLPPFNYYLIKYYFATATCKLMHLMSSFQLVQVLMTHRNRSNKAVEKAWK